MRYVYAMAGAIVLALVATLPFLPGLPGAFLFDDYHVIVDNRALVVEDFAPGPLLDAALSTRTGMLKRPLALLSFALDRKLHGLAPAGWPADFTACQSQGDIVRYVWAVDRLTVVDSPHCAARITFPREGRYQVELTVVGASGATAKTAQDVNIQDWLIIGLGDSYGSGEGVPDVPMTREALVAYLGEQQEQLALATLTVFTAAGHELVHVKDQGVGDLGGREMGESHLRTALSGHGVTTVREVATADAFVEVAPDTWPGRFQIVTVPNGSGGGCVSAYVFSPKITNATLYELWAHSFNDPTEYGTEYRKTFSGPTGMGFQQVEQVAGPNGTEFRIMLASGCSSTPEGLAGRQSAYQGRFNGILVQVKVTVP